MDQQKMDQQKQIRKILTLLLLQKKMLPAVMTLVHKSNELADHVKPQASNVESSNTFSTQNPASRPLYPPGFTSRIMEKNVGAKSLCCASVVERGTSLKYPGSSGHQPFDTSVLNTSSKGHTGKLENNMFLNRMPVSESLEELQSVEESVSVQRKTVAAGFTKDVSDSSSVFDINVFPSAVNEGIMELSPFTGFDEKTDLAVEFCLPEEDSLITIDDPIIPQHSLFMSAGNSLKGGLTTSNMPVRIAEKLAALNISFSDERFTIPHLGGPPFLHDSYSVLGLETTYHNLCARQSNPQFHQTNLNLGGPYVQSLGSNQSHLISQIKSIDRKSYHNPLPHHDDFPANLYFSPPCARADRFYHPVHQSLVPQMQIPGQYAPYQSTALSRCAPHPQSINQVACYADGVSPVHSFHLSCQQPDNGGLGMLNQGNALGTQLEFGYISRW